MGLDVSVAKAEVAKAALALILLLAAAVTPGEELTVCNRMAVNPGVVLHRVLWAMTQDAHPPATAADYPGTMPESFIPIGGCASLPPPAAVGSYFLHLRYEYSSPDDGENASAVASRPFRVTLPGFYTVTPCRALDTRLEGPPLYGMRVRAFAVGGKCGIPVDALAAAVNVTVVNPTEPGHLTIWPEGETMPLASTINYRKGQVRANNSILKLGTDGVIRVSCGQSKGSTDFIVDVVGYFERAPSPPPTTTTASTGLLAAVGTGLAALGAGGFWLYRRSRRAVERKGGP